MSPLLYAMLSGSNTQTNERIRLKPLKALSWIESFTVLRW